MTIYDLPTFSSTLELLTMLALSTGRLLKATLISSSSFLSFDSQTDFHSFRVVLPTSSPWRAKYLSMGNHQKKSCSSPNHPCCILRIYRLRFPEAVGKLLRAPRRQPRADRERVQSFMLEGLFCNIGMDVEVDARSGPVVGGMIVDDNTPCVLHPPNPLPALKQ